MMVKYIIGLDEVGRGCLAGPVVVGAVALEIGRKIRHPKFGRPRDSKKLSKLTREAWLEYVDEKGEVPYSIGVASEKEIDRFNVSVAANKAAARAFKTLNKKIGQNHRIYKIYLDGGLYIGKKGKIPGAITAPKSDDKYIAVSLASIIAKVKRDKFMQKMALKYKGYDFEKNVGYGTKRHYAGLRKLGPTPIHRLTFLGKSRIIRKKRK